jgi:hypothetical protein
MKYGQFCPLAKATEILCEKWILLIVRDFLMSDVLYRTAVADGKMKVFGHQALTRNIESWLAPSIFAGIPPAKEIG